MQSQKREADLNAQFQQKRQTYTQVLTKLKVPTATFGPVFFVGR